MNQMSSMTSATVSETCCYTNNRAFSNVLCPRQNSAFLFGKILCLDADRSVACS